MVDLESTIGKDKFLGLPKANFSKFKKNYYFRETSLYLCKFGSHHLV
jgi:hypothetical protein